MSISIIIPAKNEALSIGDILKKINQLQIADEVIVVNDASNDNTAEIAQQLGAKVINLPYSIGNGAAVRSGARIATGDILVFLDADGQHRPEDIPLLLQKLNENYAMVVAARKGFSQHATIFRALANNFYNRFSSWMVGHKIEDLTSGFRAVHARYFCEFLSLLPNGFSYPTTITMSFFRCGLPVAYVPVTMPTRDKDSQSHINPLKDGFRFALIIFKVGSLFSPLKLFLPISLFFAFSGLSYYAYTFFTVHRLTNMTVLLLINAILIFLIGLVSEQITTLIYKGINLRVNTLAQTKD